MVNYLADSILVKVMKIYVVKAFINSVCLKRSRRIQ